MSIVTKCYMIYMVNILHKSLLCHFAEKRETFIYSRPSLCMCLAFMVEWFHSMQVLSLHLKGLKDLSDTSSHVWDAFCGVGRSKVASPHVRRPPEPFWKALLVFWAWLPCVSEGLHNAWEKHFQLLVSSPREFSPCEFAPPPRLGLEGIILDTDTFYQSLVTLDLHDAGW